MAANPPELVWAPTARRDLVDIWFYFAGVGSPEVAERLLHDIDKAAKRLIRFPMAGRSREDVAPYPLSSCSALCNLVSARPTSDRNRPCSPCAA